MFYKSYGIDKYLHLIHLMTYILQVSGVNLNIGPGLLVCLKNLLKSSIIDTF